VQRVKRIAAAFGCAASSLTFELSRHAHKVSMSC
jgi:hypothetical protein